MHPLSAAGHWWTVLAESDGPVCGGAVLSQQELLRPAHRVAEGGAAVARLPLLTSLPRAEGHLQPAGP